MTVPTIPRRAVLLSMLSLPAFPLARAQAIYPVRPLRMVVPFAAGGPTDFVARTAGEAMSKSLGQPVILENRPGAEGALAAQAVMASPADGYTLLVVAGSMVALPLVNKSVAINWQTDLTPVGTTGQIAFCAVVHPEVPAKTIAELVGHARANPGKLNYAASTLSEMLAAVQFMKATGTSMTRVAYKGGAQAMPDLLAGRVHLTFGPLALSLPHAKDGKLRLLATLLPQRSPLAPEVPTMAEAGFPGVTVPTWQAIFAPAGTPREIVDRLATDLQVAVAQPALRTAFEQRAVQPDRSTPAELAARVRADQGLWAELVRDHKLAGD